MLPLRKWPDRKLLLLIMMMCRLLWIGFGDSCVSVSLRLSGFGNLLVVLLYVIVFLTGLALAYECVSDIKSGAVVNGVPVSCVKVIVRGKSAARLRFWSVGRLGQLATVMKSGLLRLSFRLAVLIMCLVS